MKKTSLLFTLSVIGLCSAHLMHPKEIPHNSQMGKTVTISVPKCGTFLLYKCLFHLRDEVQKDYDGYIWLNKLLFDRLSDKGILVTHAVYCPQNVDLVTQSGCKAIFIYRDPRDQVVSMVYHIYNDPFARQKHQRKTVEELITELILDGTEIHISGSREPMVAKKGIYEFYQGFLPWRDHDYVYVTQFEKLIGPRGGGSLDEQLTEIVNIAQHVGLKISRKQAQEVAHKMFGESKTFRKGQIGTWREHFTQEHIRLFKEVAGQLLIDLGYEKDLDWQ